MTRAEALALPHAEPLLNGRCVGHIELDERYGTVLVMDWHDPDGCEHVQAEPRQMCTRCGVGPFVLVATRDHPTLCLDCSADANRAEHGWTPENSLS